MPPPPPPLLRSILNQHLQSLMPGLTAKVFRTYNASDTLQRQLPEEEALSGLSLAEKVRVLHRRERWNAAAILVASRKRLCVCICCSCFFCGFVSTCYSVSFRKRSVHACLKLGRVYLVHTVGCVSLAFRWLSTTGLTGRWRSCVITSGLSARRRRRGWRSCKIASRC